MHSYCFVGYDEQETQNTPKVRHTVDAFIVKETTIFMFWDGVQDNKSSKVEAVASSDVRTMSSVLPFVVAVWCVFNSNK